LPLIHIVAEMKCITLSQHGERSQSAHTFPENLQSSRIFSEALKPAALRRQTRMKSGFFGVSKCSQKPLLGHARIADS
jgi:hypothetical protein